MEFGKVDDGQSQQVAVGEEVMLRLAENPGTGYRWTVSTSNPDVLVALADTNVATTKPGMASDRTFTFKAAKPGRTTLHAECRRAWEREGTPADDFEMTIEVSPL
jgi:predicted secreted protein